jgi:ribosomal protein S24E
LELKIKKDEYNPLLKRKEVYADVGHENGGSPSRLALRDAVASKYGVKSESVYVVDIHTRTGTQESECIIQVYDDLATAKLIVPEYIRVRNLPSEERKKVREQKAKKKEEKPKEAPKKETKPKETAAPKEQANESKEPTKETKEPKEAKEGKETPKQKGKETGAK